MPIQKAIKLTSPGYAFARPRNSYIKQEREATPIILLSGTYTIDNSNIDAFPVLNVYKDERRGVWWASTTLETDYEHLDFVIKMDPGPSGDALGRAVTLGWRMRNMDSEEVKFGSGCTGEATFFEDNDVAIVLRNVPGLGDVKLSGSRRGGPSQPGDLQEEWDEFRRDAYGR